MSTPRTQTASPTATAQRAVRRRGLVLLLALLTTGTAVLLGVGFWSFVAAGVDDDLFIAVAVHVTVGVVTLSLALSLGQLELHRAARPAGGERPRPVTLLVWGSITGALALTTAIAAVVTGLSAWITVGFLLGVIGTSAASWLLGHRTRLRHDARQASRSRTGEGVAPDLDWTPAMVRRKVLTIGLVLLLTAAAATVLMVVLADEFDGGLLETVPLIVQISFTAAALTGFITTIQLQSAVAPVVRDLDPAQRKSVNRRTLGKSGPLDPELEWRAARAAAVARVSQPLTLLPLGLMLIASLSTFVRLSADGGFAIFTGICFAVVLGLVPFLVVEQRRRRRYADASRELAWSDGPAVRAAAEQGTGSAG
ncbi:hypothetical protein [Clavibacter michiganensis]|uniref:hypothetical protein n=1 Tax=Clavibacter michiganensis TaxID=28447 RepID=UPI00126987EF|nr:hypothetical protein [Clavibacter michiganensis]